MPTYTRRVMQDAAVFEEPDNSSKSLGTIKAKRYIRVLDVQRTWLHVQDMANVNLEGYISVNTLVPARGAAKDTADVPQENSLESDAESTPMGDDTAYDHSIDSPETRRRKAVPPPPPPSDSPEGVPLEIQVSDKILLTGSYIQKMTAKIWNKYGGLLSALAKKHGIDPIDIAAVMAVESGGEPFGPDGRMIIRFEPHLFYRHWGQHNQGKFFNHFQFDPDQQWKHHTFRRKVSDVFATFHGNQSLEWAAFEFARRLMGQAAKMSISMGMSQILGSNFKVCGYTSVDEMFDAFNDPKEGERQQILGLFRFIENDYRNRGIPALRNKDYVAFAEMYNGPGQSQTYGNLIAERVRMLQQLLAM